MSLFSKQDNQEKDSTKKVKKSKGVKKKLDYSTIQIVSTKEEDN